MITGIRKAASICLILCLLPGCWDRIEVNDMALIMAVGIDKAQDQLIELTVQVFIPNPSAGGSGGASGDGEGRVYTLSRIGETLPDALTVLQKELPRTFFWGHAKAYIFGEALAKDGMEKQLDFLFRDIEPREQANIYLCRKTAKKLLLSLSDPNSYETLIKLGQKRSLEASSIISVAELIGTDSESFTLPIAKTSALISGGKAKSILIVEGDALIKERKAIAFLDEEITEGLQWFQNMKIERNVAIALEDPNKKITIKLKRSSTKIIPVIDKGKWSITLKLKINADVADNATNLNLMDEHDYLKKIEKPFNQLIEHKIANAINRLQTQYHADPLDLAHAFHKKYPRIWKENRTRWEAIYKKLDVKVEVNTIIRNPGISNINVRVNKGERS
ncbi:Ger(x)C family spore germination protein [Paenibacillus luteus]|uniref:Ger(x)C family spore germination protein n=1 Tax=Paenibacillus luteus TaxID=2545753 RepID=UPI00114407D5|nr:Ger(x)C family spore germination protein [Paenibacillus luteus]